MRRYLPVLLLAALPLCALHAEEEPTYEGKTVSEWIEALKDEDKDVRSGAAEALGEIGPAAKPAVPALIEALGDEDSRVPVFAAALVKIGADAVPALVVALKENKRQVRPWAASILARIGPDARAAIPALVEALRDGRKEVRWGAAHALGGIDPAARAATPALREALKDQDRDVRAAAASALGKVGPDAEAAVPALIQALKDDDQGVRKAAAKALAKIGPDAKAAISALIGALRNEPECAMASFALERIGSPAVPALAKALSDESQSVGWWAALALAGSDPDAKAEVPTLDTPRHRNLFALIEAREPMAAIGADAKAAVPPLSKALNDQDPLVQFVAIRALGAIGPDAKSAIPALIEVLRDDDSPEVRKMAADALGRTQVRWGWNANS